MKCRHCGAPLRHVFIDLGHQPPSNAYLKAEQLHAPEVHYPLTVYVCDGCWLVQLPAHVAPDQLFRPDYAYLSATSAHWVAHAERYVGAIVERLALNAQSLVSEVGSNDGYLLQFMMARGIPCVGIEPTAHAAGVARDRGIETLEAFFGACFAGEFVNTRRRVDLLIANNVLAHVPNVNDFVAGIRRMLAPTGVATLEFPHLLELVEGAQFDTIYHEHYSYFSLHAVRAIFEAQGLRIFDVETLPTHGGSLRVYATPLTDHGPRAGERIAAVLDAERDAGMLDMTFYDSLQPRAERIKNTLLRFLLRAKEAGRLVVGYGAAAKGNTLLNFAGIRPDLLPFVCDAATSKQGRFLPGSHIPIVAPDMLRGKRPDDVLILPWNIKDEIMHDHAYVRDWGGRFAWAIPELEIS